MTTTKTTAPETYTLDELAAMFPHAHIEFSTIDRVGRAEPEVVIYTGLTPVGDGPATEWMKGMFDACNVFGQFL